MMGENSAATPERRIALRILERVRGGAYADRALRGEMSRAPASVSRSQVHRLVFGVVQRQRTLDWLIDDATRASSRIEPAVRDVLRLATYELCWSSGVASAVVVDQAVTCAGGIPGDRRRRQARRGLVNAVARRIAETHDERLSTLGDATWQDAAIMHSAPDWIAQGLFESLGSQDARRALAAANEPTESIVRWNPAAGSREDLVALLPNGAVQCDPPFSDAYRIDGAFALEDSEVWHRGLAMAQSRASMLPILALDPRPGERVLDMCAAPGAKTTQIAARIGPTGRVTAIELHEHRASALDETARRMGCEIDVICGDARNVEAGGGFDAVLVDPPCTGLGVLSSRPDARWRRREESLPGLRALQAELLERALMLCAPSGRVVYSTCTLLREENEDIVRAAPGVLDDLRPLAPMYAHPGLEGALRTVPGRDDTDGFFVARLRPRRSG